MSLRGLTRPVALAAVAMVLLMALPATALAQEIPQQRPPNLTGEPTKPSGEPVPNRVGHEVLLISGANNFNYVQYFKVEGTPLLKASPNDVATKTAEEYAERWRDAGYRTTITYAPPTVQLIEMALKTIAKRYQGKEAALQQIALHYWGHGDDGVILPGKENGMPELEITHEAIGTAVANAFPDDRFTKLTVVALFDACEQGGALVDFRDAVKAGRAKGTTTGHTISSTRTMSKGPRAAWCAGSLYSTAFLTCLDSPASESIKAAHWAGVQAQEFEKPKPGLEDGGKADWFQALGEAVIDSY